MTTPIVAFLTGEGVDGAGRSLKEVLALDDAELERRHDFIQWLFPLPEASRAVAGAPVLSAGDVRQLRGSPAARANLRAATARMSRFYAQTSHWLAPHDHNHLRITRIIKSLRLLAGDAAADGFREAILSRVSGRRRSVSQMSLEFWMAA
jgi:hypothetical protein